MILLASEMISGVETNLVKHNLRKSCLLLIFMCLILFLMSVMYRFFRVMGFLSLVIRYSNEETVLVDIELTFLDVTMVCMDCQADRNNKNISKSKVMEIMFY